MSDIGAIESGRWHDSHFAWKIRETSFVNVGVVLDSAGSATSDTVRDTLSSSAPSAMRRHVRPVRFHIRRLLSGVTLSVMVLGLSSFAQSTTGTPVDLI